ncbi:MAG: adenine deaminase [Pseudomonadota bacterium]
MIWDTKSLERRIDAALGKIPFDTVLIKASVLNIFSGTWEKKDIGIIDGMVVSVDSNLKGKRTFDLSGKWIIPGFIDAHVHIESSLLIPNNFQRVVLSKGTTSAICDPHELANVQGIGGIDYFLKESENLSLDLRVMLSSCVPATSMETNGGGTLGSIDLLPFKNHPRALGLAEVMNVPGVIHKDEEVLSKILNFVDGPLDGHCPLLRGSELSAYAATGISSCHESSELEEAHEKLQKGISIWIREGSVAKDLNQLIPLLNEHTWPFVGFCTDDRNPLDIAKEGHIDYLVRQAIRKGVPAPLAYRSASWSVANHYGLNRGWNRMGAIGPGYRADLVILEDADTCSIHSVFKSGKLVSELSFEVPNKNSFTNSIKTTLPELTDLNGPSGRVHCIEIQPGKIITGRSIRLSTDREVARLSVLERHGHGSKPANGYVVGFGENFQGAIASSVGHDSHNLCVVGKDPADMQIALKALIESGGGFAVVQGKKVIAHLPLPFGGLMSFEEPAFIEKKLIELREASRSIGCCLAEPFLQLAFLCLPVIPSLKLTDKGLVDVDKFSIIDVRA